MLVIGSINMSSTQAIVSGVAGASALNLAHQALQGVTVDAPRMEILGMRAMKKGFEAAGEEVPPRSELYPLTLMGDLISNSGYYSLVGLAKPENAIVTGAALGLAAGVGAVTLPGGSGQPEWTVSGAGDTPEKGVSEVRRRKLQP